jgi:hypothetical protein
MPSARHCFLGLFAVLAVGCSHSASPLVKELDPAAVAALRGGGKAVLFDVNGEGFRKNNGVVPGARMLASSSAYALDQLPEDRDTPLVFYCSNRL